MNQLYIIAHHSAYRAFEDYYDNLSKLIEKKYKVTIIIYENQKEIPIDNQGVYLFFGLIPPSFMKLPHVYLLNTEQISRKIWSLIIKNYIDAGRIIFDYNLYQTRLSQSSSHIYLPYQIDPDEDHYLTSLIEQTPKKYDVAFCSTNGSKRRNLIFSQLVEKGLNVIDVTGWKSSRDRDIASAKILVNIHFDTDYQIFEHMRCDRWIMAGLLVISENSLSDSINDLGNLVICDQYENLVDRIIDVVTHYESYYYQYLMKLGQEKSSIIVNRFNHYEMFINRIGFTNF